MGPPLGRRSPPRGNGGQAYSPPPSPGYSHNHGKGRRSRRHSPDRYSSRSGQSGSEWTDREYYENTQVRRRDHKSGTPLRDDRQGDKRKQRQYNENGVTTDEERYGYASGSNNLRDRPNPHSRKREKAIGDDSVNSSSGLQGKH